MTKNNKLGKTSKSCLDSSLSCLAYGEGTSLRPASREQGRERLERISYIFCFLKFFQLKIFSIPRCYILGECVLNLVTSHPKCIQPYLSCCIYLCHFSNPLSRPLELPLNSFLHLAVGMIFLNINCKLSYIIFLFKNLH